MSTRDFRARWTGDASDFLASAKEVQAGAKSTDVAMRSSASSADNVGKTFTKSGKLVKATGKVFKSSGIDALSAGSAFASTVPALSGVAGGAGQAIAAFEALGPLLLSSGPAGLALVGASAVAAGAAFLILHDDVESATRALRDQQKENAELSASHKATTDSVLAARESLRSLEDNSVRQKTAAINLAEANKRVADAAKAGGKSSLEYRDAQLALEKANQKVTLAEAQHGQSSTQYRQALLDREKATLKVTEAEKSGGKGSLEYRQAVLAQTQAQLELTRSRQDQIPLGQKAIEQSKATTKAIDDEVEETHKKAQAARLLDAQVRAGIVHGKDAAAVSREAKRATDAEARASATAAAKHKDNAQNTIELANAIGTATRPAKALHDRLVELARQELDLASAIAAMQRLSGAADTAAAGVQHVYDLVRNPPTWGPDFFGGGSPPKGGTPPKKKSDERDPRTKSQDDLRTRPRPRAPSFAPRPGELNPITRSDRADAAITARHRDDSLQDTQERERILGDPAKVGGISNPDKLAAIGDKAVAELRKRELDADAETVRTARNRVEGDIGKKRTAKAGKIKKRRNTRRQIKQKNGSMKDNPAWQKLTDEIDSLTDAIRNLWDEHRTLGREYADIQAEAAEFGHTIANLSSQIASLPDVVPPDESAPASTDSSSSATADAAPSPDAQAQIDQSNARATSFQQEKQALEAYIQTFRGSGSIDPGLGTVVQQFIYGGMVEQSWAGQWITSALARQGSPSSGYVPSPV